MLNVTGLVHSFFIFCYVLLLLFQSINKQPICVFYTREINLIFIFFILNMVSEHRVRVKFFCGEATVTTSPPSSFSFYRHSSVGCIYLVVYVDDIFLTTPRNLSNKTTYLSPFSDQRSLQTQIFIGN